MAIYLGSKKVTNGNYKGGVDASGVTTSTSDVLYPKIFVDSNGVEQTGTIVTKTSSDLTASGATVTVPAGYYASQATKSVATATQATPSISVSSSGLITASATQSAGYVSSGTKSATKQLTTKGTADYTPSTSNQTIPSGTYLTGTQTILGDSNLVASNIKSGVSIFGVSGSYSGDGNYGCVGAVIDVSTGLYSSTGSISVNLPLGGDNLIGIVLTTTNNEGYNSILSNDNEYLLALAYYFGNTYYSITFYPGSSSFGFHGNVETRDETMFSVNVSGSIVSITSNWCKWLDSYALAPIYDR